MIIVYSNICQIQLTNNDKSSYYFSEFKHFKLRTKQTSPYALLSLWSFLNSLWLIHNVQYAYWYTSSLYYLIMNAWMFLNATPRFHSLQQLSPQFCPRSWSITTSWPRHSVGLLRAVDTHKYCQRRSLLSLSIDAPHLQKSSRSTH